jgi:hypothetical protein
LPDQSEFSAAVHFVVHGGAETYLVPSSNFEVNEQRIANAREYLEWDFSGDDVGGQVQVCKIDPDTGEHSVIVEKEADQRECIGIAENASETSWEVEYHFHGEVPAFWEDRALSRNVTIGWQYEGKVQEYRFLEVEEAVVREVSEWYMRAFGTDPRIDAFLIEVRQKVDYQEDDQEDD